MATLARVNKCVGVMLLVVLLQNFAESRRIPPWQLKIAQSQGPNTCAVEEVPGTNKKYWTECKYWMNREICGVKTVLRYECCEGFHQVANKEGCTGVKPMTNVLQTAQDLGATVFVDYLKTSGISSRLQRQEAITLFAPTNEAFEQLTASDQEALKVSLLQGQSPYLLYHTVGGRKLHSRDFHGEQEVETLTDGAHKIRINRYSNGMITVNCAPIIRKDQQATNGIVHLIDQVLIPPVGQSDRSSIPELVFTDGRFRELSRIMLQSDFVHELRRGGPYTLLAPTDEAFQNINPYELSRISNDAEARKALMKNHLIPHSICIPAVIDSHKMKNVAGHKLELFCNQTGVYVEGGRLGNEQMIAQNGVINMLSKVIIPDRARSVMELVERRSKPLSTFTRLLKKAGMEDYLLEPNITVTVFAPSNYAFLQMPEEEFSRLDEDAEKLRELIHHHIVVGKVKSETLSDNQRVPTYDRQNSLRLKVYRKEIGVESAIIEESDIEGQNGVIHIIDAVLTPPKHSIMELLENNGEYSMMADAIHKVQAFEPHFLAHNRAETSYTIFAPTNNAFHELGDHHLNSLMKNKRRLKRMVQNHVVDNMFSARSIHNKLQYDVRTEYQTVKVHKEKGNLMVNSAHVIKPDVLVTDGIVHCIDRVLVPHGRRKS